MAKYVVVTGGSRGIGKAVISRFMADGWEAINLSRSPCAIPNVHNISVDLGRADWPATHGATLQTLTQSAEHIALIHNASALHKDNIETLQPDAFRQILDNNLVSILTLSQLLIPNMRAGSAIIYIGSTLSEMAVPNCASYVITKHALVGMMRVTCQDLKGRGITTCCVCPGFVNTHMLTDHLDKAVLDRVIKDKVTAGRLIETPEIAEFIYFCAQNPVLNGAVLHANLGHINN